MKQLYVSSLIFLCAGCGSKRDTVELEVPPPVMHVHTVYPGAFPPVYHNTGMIIPDSGVVSEYAFPTYLTEDKSLYSGN